jgi:hypothetical protein
MFMFKDSMKNFTKLIFTALLFCSVNALFAQGTSARISGKITDAKKQPMIGAIVQAVNTSNGFKTATASDDNGSYELQELPLGGPYTLTFSSTGSQTVKQTGYNLGLGDHLTVDVELKEGATELGAVEVTANAMTSRTDRLGSALAITGKTIATIPTPSRNFEQLAFLSGQSYTPDLGQRNLGGFTLAGGKGGNGGFTVDGANTRRGSFGSTLDGAAFTISQEAIREFEVETNAYSVKNGRNSGGVVKAVTKSGTNEVHGAAWYYAGGGDALSQTKSPTGALLASVPSQGQYGLSVSGPIIKDKLFYFVAIDRYATSPLTDPRTQFFVDYANPVFANEGEANTFYGYTKTDAQAVVDAAKAKGYDVGSGIGTLKKDAVTQNVFARMDWQINDKNRASIRYNYLKYNLTNEGISGNQLSLAAFLPNSVRVNGTDASNYPFENLDHKIIADLRTDISKNIVNKAVFQFNTSDRGNNPKDATQEPRVYVGVPAANGLGGGTMAFGQLTWIPELMRTTSYQFIDDVTYKTNGVTWTFGTNNQFYQQAERLAHWTAPVVVYQNVADLNANKPSFYRQLLSDKLDLKALQPWKLAELSLYAEAAFKIGNDINMEAGIRWDGTYQSGVAPTRNEAVFAGLTYNGRALDNSKAVSDMAQWQPRVQMTWDIGGEKKHFLKAGAGMIASPITTQPITQTYYNDGVHTRQFNYTNNADIVANVGAAGNYADPANWLSKKFEGQSLPAGSANTILVDPNFKMPSTLRTNISYTYFFSDRFRATIMGCYNVGFNDNYWINANRKVDSLNRVDGREMTSAKIPALQNVVMFTNADWTSKYMAAQLDLTMKIGKDGLLNVTLTKAKGTGVTTYHAGGVFDDAEYVGADYYNRYKTHMQNSHQNGVGDKVVVVFASPQFAGWNIGFSLMAAHQRRFSITTTGNPNTSTDRDLAYVPTAAELTAAENKLLANVAGEVRDVLVASSGQITGVYQGVYPWMYQTSASVSKRFKLLDQYGVTLRADFFNLLNMISSTAGYYSNLNSTQDDYYGRFVNLFNYTGPTAANPTNYRYGVNSGQGTYTRGGSPFSIQLGAKVDF